MEAKVEILEVDIVDEAELPSMDTLEAEFSIFIAKTEETAVRMGNDIQMDEVKDLEEEILKAAAYLSSFASGAKKSVRTRAYNMVALVPGAGKWAQAKVEEVKIQDMKDSGVAEVIEGIFDNFATKKKRLVELTYLAEDIRKNLLADEVILTAYKDTFQKVIDSTDSAGDKMRAYDMSNHALATLQIIQDQVGTKLNVIIELMEILSGRMSQMIAGKKAQLLNETAIAGMMSSINDTIRMVDTLQGITNKIAKESTENVLGLIVDTKKAITSGVDIEFYKESAKIQAKFQQTMLECDTEYVKETLAQHDALVQMGVDTSNQIESRRDNERLALGMSIESKKKTLQEDESA